MPKPRIMAELHKMFGGRLSREEREKIADIAIGIVAEVNREAANEAIAKYHEVQSQHEK